jgi:hypothetical protein
MQRQESDSHTRIESGADIQFLLDTLPLKQATSRIAHLHTWGRYRTRANEGRLTGEWIVFTKDDAGRNLYLAAARHRDARETESAQELYELILSRCDRHFFAMLQRGR